MSERGVLGWIGWLGAQSLSGPSGLPIAMQFAAATGKSWAQLLHAVGALDRGQTWLCVQCLEGEPDEWIYEGKLVPEGTPGAVKFHNTGWLAGVCGNPNSKVVRPWRRHLPEETARRLAAFDRGEQ